MKLALTTDELIQAARNFCERESKINHDKLIGVTDGKAVGTYVEHKFKHFIQSQYEVEVGNMVCSFPQNFHTCLYTITV